MAIAPAMTPPEEMGPPPMVEPNMPSPGPIDVQVVPDNGPIDADEIGGTYDETPLEHRVNLAEYLDEEDLRGIASELLTLVEQDQNTRSEWLETYTEGLDYLGFKFEDRQSPFPGSCGVYHPVLTEAVVRFQSNAIMEIFPAAGPALTRIYGDPSPEKEQQAKRVKEELNYQLTENMAEYRNETEQLLFRLPLAGSVFRKVYFDPIKKRPAACMVPAEDFIVDYGCSDLENCERYTHSQKKSVNLVKKLQRAGFYRQVKLPKPEVTSPTDGRAKEDEISGIEPSITEDRYTIYEVYCYLNLPGPFEDPQDIADPYIVTIEKQSQTVLAIYRNWAEGDDTDRVMEQYFAHYQYLPGLGFYGFGLVHLIGSIAKGATSILRQLIDAGTLSNLPGGLKTRGLRTKGDDTPIAPGEWRDVDVPAGTIQQNLYPMPYKEPSAVLANLLQQLIEEGRRVGSIADVEISSTAQNAPVGTTLALLERSLKVMSAVHARLHASLRRELRLIGKVIYDYMPEQYAWDETQQFNRRQDFDGRVDVIPVSDPNASTQALKIIQMQAVQQQAQLAPELYNMRELHRAGLDAIGIKNVDRILPPEQQPPRMDPVQENMAMLQAQPVKVFPDQDHTAHIQVHLSLATDPKLLDMIKNSPNAAKLQGQMEAHLAEHLAHQYHDEMQQIMGVQLPPLGEQQPPEVEAMLSRALADASVRLRELHDAQAKQMEAEKIANDPVYQLQREELDLKKRKQDFEEREANADRLVKIAKDEADDRIKVLKIQSDERKAGAKIGADLVTFGAQLESEERREGVSLGKEITENIRSDMRETQRMMQDDNRRVDELADRERQRQHDAQQRQADRMSKERSEARKASAQKQNRPKGGSK